MSFAWFDEFFSWESSPLPREEFNEERGLEEGEDAWREGGKVEGGVCDTRWEMAGKTTGCDG